MPLKSALLASAATPLLILSLTSNGQAQPALPSTAASPAAFVVAQADQPQQDERRHKHHQRGDQQPDAGQQPAQQTTQPSAQSSGDQGAAGQDGASDSGSGKTQKRHHDHEQRGDKGAQQPEKAQQPAPSAEKRSAPAAADGNSGQGDQQRKSEQRAQTTSSGKSDSNASDSAGQPKHHHKDRKESGQSDQNRDHGGASTADHGDHSKSQSDQAPDQAKDQQKPSAHHKQSDQQKMETKQAPAAEPAPAAKQAAPQAVAPQQQRSLAPQQRSGESAQQPALKQPSDQGQTSDQSQGERNGKRSGEHSRDHHRDRNGQQADGQNGQAAEQPNALQPNAQNAQPAAKGAPVKQNGSNLAAPQPLDAAPAKNAATVATPGAKPERLNVPNGAPVLDSAKDYGQQGQQDRNGDRRQLRQADQSRQDRERYNQPVDIRSATEVKGERVKEAPQYAPPKDVHVEKKVDNRYIVTINNKTVIENTDHHRIAHDARDVYYEDLPHNNTRQVVVRPDGVRVVTIRNEYGDILQRSRFDRGGQETVLIYAPDYDRGDRRDFYREPDLPPIRLTEPVDDYILEAGGASTRQIVTFLEKPPIEPIEHVYTLDQVRYSARLRDIMPRIDIDTITFSTGSAAIEQSQARSLEALAKAIQDVVQRDPGQVFLIEGHTDAVGSDQSNLILSDKRAESVAEALTQDFDVPPENLVTQGYGEQYLKIDTQGPERANRRVTVRRITPLVRPTASR